MIEENKMHKVEFTQELQVLVIIMPRMRQWRERQRVG